MNLTYLGDDSGLIARTGKLYNQNRTGYVPPPFILRQTPTQTATINISDRFYHITVEYDETLELADGYLSDEDIRTKITCRSRLGADVTGDQYSEIRNFRWDGDRTVEFDMKFSMMFADDNVIYNIFLEGLVGETSKKAPNPISYTTRQKLVCPCIMRRNGNWDVFGKPTLLESDDLSMEDWTTSNGVPVSDLLKDRLTLVTTQTTEKQEEQIAEQVKNENILKSATYNISLSVCKSMVIKTGHKVKVRLGFPEGFGPGDEGVTYKAYHFKQDNQGNVTGVEEIDCVVTQYGLIITCDSFSPFMIAAVESDGSEETSRTLVVTASDGGTVDCGDTSGILRLNEGESQIVTYTANPGYQIESLTVCGREVEVTDKWRAQVTLRYEDVQSANNVVNAGFVSQAVAENEAENGETAAALPVITMPAPTPVTEGGTLVIEPEVTVEGMQTFQWYKNGRKLEGQTGMKLEITDVTAEDAGTYTLVVTTTVGAVTTVTGSDYVFTLHSECGHPETEIRNSKAATVDEKGYTGDVYCKLCGALIQRGKVIPKLSGGDTPGTGGTPDYPDYDYDDSDSSYTVQVSKVSHGSVRVSPGYAEKGTTVTVTVTPDEGYALRELSVLDKNGRPVSLTRKSDSEYTFTMPEGRVKTEASFESLAAPDQRPAFADVPESSYCYDAVLWAVERGITNGTSNGTFSPNASCTRAQMVTFLWRAAGSPRAAGENPFTDVSGGAYYYDAVLWAVEQGITNGASATSFAPDATVTRGQTVTFLYRANGSPASSGGGFADVPGDAYYADAVAWALSEGITTGMGNNAFAPNANCTRGQIVTFLYRDAQ